MDFNNHSNLRGTHAFLSPSNYHWINYDEQKLRARLNSHKAAARGTRIHAWAHEAINLNMRMQRSRNHIYRYINDGIGYGMTTEFMVVATSLAYGEADTLKFGKEPGIKKNVLRVHDLKTGLITAGITQLELYAAYFCIEYDVDPRDIETILNIYQNNQIIGGTADPKRIRELMKKTEYQDAKIREFQQEAM